MTQPRILAIDDNPANLLTLGAALADDHELQLATSGQQGLDMVEAWPPDLILLDMQMPGMDGIEVCHRLQANPETTHIPVIFITALHEPEDETRALEAGGVDFITKPVNLAVVRARVKTHLTLKAQSDQLRSIAFSDGLTGVINQRRFNEILLDEWNRAAHTASPLALLMVDIDHLKFYNDHYGHLAGDSCLQTIASLLKAHFSHSRNFVARYGGEEFACLLPETDILAAQKIAEELRLQVEQLAIPHANSPVAGVLTVSIGVTALQPGGGSTPNDLVSLADLALYLAKSDGRNRVGVGN